jgi:hypothetical protein
MKLYPLQSNFSFGILTPRMQSQSGRPEYRAGIADSLNVVPYRHGVIESRGGTRYRETMAGEYSRCFGFQLIPNSKTSEAYFATASDDGSIELVGLTGAVGVNQELLNPGFTNNIDNWTRIYTSGLSSVVWSPGVATLNPEKTINGAVAGVSQEITFDPGTESEDRTAKFSVAYQPDAVGATMYIKVGTTSGGNDIAEFSTLSTTGSLTFNPAGASSLWVTFEAKNQQFIGLPEPGGPPPEYYGYVKLFDTEVNLNIDGDVAFSHPWSSSDIQNMQVEMSPNNNDLYFLTQNVAPYKLSYNIDTDTWSFASVSFTSLPSSWVAGNFPTTLGFFQGRSWWGGVESNPQTFWASKPNDESTVANELEDLTLGTTAADALEFNLSKSGRIRWIEGGANLMIGTTAGEFLINGQQGVITPSDIQVYQQSANGGDQVNARKIGDMILFVSSDGRKLLATRYYEDHNQWRAQEISFTAEHLTEGKRIIDIQYARNPESIIWCLLDDGSLIGCSYDPFYNTIGWHRHTSGFIQGIATVEKAGTSVLGMTVLRHINGSDVVHFEEMSSDYMDSYVIVEPDGLEVSVPHLAGETVTVKVGDAQHEDITLDSSGNGTLTYAGSPVVIGLDMPQMILTLEPDIGAPAGSSMGYSKSWNKITARIIASAYPTINGTRPKVRYPGSAQDYREPNKSIDISVSNLGYGSGSILIEQDLPYKLTLSALFGAFDQGTL